MTGLSRAQVTRLIQRYQKSGKVKVTVYQRHRFPQRYTAVDVELLVRVDEAHQTLSGPATQRILQREYQQYGKQEYKRLADISVAHLYNLRQRPRYRQQRLQYTKTRPPPVAIGERRRPQPQGRPGFLRVDTVHQGMPRPEKVCITSMRWMKSPSGRLWLPPRTSARPIWNRCCGRCWSSFHFAFWAFIPTMAARTSTPPWPVYCTNY